MTSIKRLLNDESDEASYNESFYDRSQEVYHRNNSPYDEIPVLAEKSWDEIWGGILNIDECETSDTLQYNVEESIESWAVQSLPPLSELSTQTEIPVAGSLVLNSPRETQNLLCYGMINRASVQVTGNMLDVDKKLTASTPSTTNQYYVFSISQLGKDQLCVNFPDGTQFGLLNTHHSIALKSLVDSSSLQFDVIASINTIRDVIGRAIKANDAVVKMNINIYGSSEERKNAAERLTKEKVYLQRPDRQRPDTIYENPHFLEFDDFSLPTTEQQLEVGSNRVLGFDNTKDFRKAISNVYASLKRGTKLNVVEGDRRLTTQLLRHQQEALDFMVQRETGPIPPEFCLWKPSQGENEGWYLHAVTKARTRIQHSETGGGILADEMGMGKSLSTLALITKTLEEADNWISPDAMDVSDDNQPKSKRSRATLVVVPSAILINEWVNEIKIHLDGTLKTIKYHGHKRKAFLPLLEDVDIVFTTYHTLVADFGEKSSPLHGIEWFRVVLDEAHIIRRQTTTFYRAVSELKARFRWCLTGTPIQNRLEDIGALFAFIQARPFHSMAMFRRFVAIPFDENQERRAVAIRNLTLLLESLCLKRSRELLQLPEAQQRQRVIEFSPEERDQYEQTKKIMNRALRQRVGEAFSKSSFGMFQIQLQLRILCNHGTYQHSFSWTKRSLLDEREDALCATGGGAEVTCSACRQSMPILGSNNVYKTFAGNCAHVICLECLDDNQGMIDTSANDITKCPLCAISGVPLPGSGLNNEEHNDSYLKAEGKSAKMVALIADIKHDLESTKSIIFSCWTNTLNLVEKYLKEENIVFARIDGDCSLSSRQKILDDFSTTSAKRVLIMTTGTGAFGLNLTSANRVFIVEPQWNPSVENQAISRAIRIKQTNSVLVTRYMIRGTVEQEMRSQQERKLRIAGIGNSTSS